MGISGFQTTFLIGGNVAALYRMKYLNHVVVALIIHYKTPLSVPLGNKLRPIGNFIRIFFKS